MAIAFKKLNKILLAPTDKLTIGKFSGCRVCDIAPDQYEYLMWMQKNNIVQLSKESLALVQKYAAAVAQARYQAEEVDPYLNQDFDDVPF